MRRKQQPLNWGKTEPKKPRQKRSKEELDQLAEEYRKWKLISIHLCIIMFAAGQAEIDMWMAEGNHIAAMKPVDIRKLKDYKQYVRVQKK